MGFFNSLFNFTKNAVGNEMNKMKAIHDEYKDYNDRDLIRIAQNKSASRRERVVAIQIVKNRYGKD